MLRLFFLLLSIFSYMIFLYFIIDFYSILFGDISLSEVINFISSTYSEKSYVEISNGFYIDFSIIIIISSFINAFIFNLSTTHIESFSDEFIIFSSIFSSILVSSVFIFGILYKTTIGNENIFLSILGLGMFIPFITSLIAFVLAEKFKNF